MKSTTIQYTTVLKVPPIKNSPDIQSHGGHRLILLIPQEDLTSSEAGLIYPAAVNGYWEEKCQYLS